jgi:hypothetical protein
MNQADDRFLASQIAKLRQQHPELFLKSEPENTGQDKRANRSVQSPLTSGDLTRGDKMKS